LAHFPHSGVIAVSSAPRNAVGMTTITMEAGDPRRQMDRMYRHQRHIYDLTRRYYLLGRDRLLDRLATELPKGALVCEVGCGTARNLIGLARRRPDLVLYGLDASATMLGTATQNLRRSGLSDRVHLRHGLAQELDHAAFGQDRRFDAVLFSYSLSMIPGWRGAVDRARLQLGPAGMIAVVDFWDQRDLPRWFRKLLGQWLALFSVRPDRRLVPFFECLAASEDADLSLRPVFGRYALMLTYRAA
jgi:S-adenosylmethionine-diacylgycerolhomoserine-N-methlytransferase